MADLTYEELPKELQEIVDNESGDNNGALLTYQNEVLGNGYTDYASSWDDIYLGHYDDKLDYFRDLIDEVVGIPEEAKNNFDYNGYYESNIRFDYAVEDAPNGGVFIYYMI